MVVCADDQWENKTKRDKVWFSPQGGLYLSVIIDLDGKKDYSSLLTLLGGTAAYHILKELGVASVLKWPNDIMVNDKKIGAIFVDSIISDRSGKYIFTINLNINVDKELLENNIDGPAINLMEVLNSHIKMEDIAAMLLNQTDELIVDCIGRKKCEKIYEPWEQYINQFDNQVKLRKYGNKKWTTCKIIGFNNSGELGCIHFNGNSDIIDTKKYEVTMIEGNKLDEDRQY
jgi:BirA family biotin operon repressor/biotin-[acetyl-CoA-carboxylase] ligase